MLQADYLSSLDKPNFMVHENRASHTQSIVRQHAFILLISYMH